MVSASTQTARHSPASSLEVGSIQGVGSPSPQRPSFLFIPNLSPILHSGQMVRPVPFPAGFSTMGYSRIESASPSGRRDIAGGSPLLSQPEDDFSGEEVSAVAASINELTNPLLLKISSLGQENRMLKAQIDKSIFHCSSCAYLRGKIGFLEREKFFLQNEFVVLNEQHQTKLDAIQKQHEESIEAIEKQYKESMEAIEKQNKESMEAIEKQYKESIDKKEFVISKKAAILTGKNQKITNLKTEIIRLSDIVNHLSKKISELHAKSAHSINWRKRPAQGAGVHRRSAAEVKEAIVR